MSDLRLWSYRGGCETPAGDQEVAAEAGIARRLRRWAPLRDVRWTDRVVVVFGRLDGDTFTTID